MPNPLRVLIVEDSESDAQLVVRLLRKVGYQVTSRRVETRDTMQAALAQDTWDSVVADYSMPEFDAFAALETLQSSGLDIPFIVVSGSIGEEAAAALMKAGAADYVMKDKMARLTAVMDRELRDAATRRERRQAMDALLASEEKYRRLFDLESDALFLVERDSGRILEANAGATAVYGYSHDEWLTMRNVDVSAEPESTEAATRTGVADIPIRWHRKKDGTVFPVDITAAHFEWQGRSVHLAVVRDITERVRAQESLRAERDRAESYLQIAGVVLVALDLQGKITLINRRGCELLGYSEEELLGRDWLETCLSPADRQAVRANFARLLAGDDMSAADFVNPVVTRSGELRLISWRKSLLRDADGQPLGMLSSGEDITERRRAEEELRLSQQRLSLHVEQTPLAVIEFDLTGRVRQWNPAAVATFGFSREEAIGQYWTFIVPAAIHGQLDGVWAAIVGQRGGNRSTNENITKDGRKISCEWFNTPLVGPGGRTIGVASLIQDITDRRRAEEQLRRSEADLRQAQHVAHVGSWRWDIKTDHLTWSDEMYRIFGITKEGFSGSLPEVIARAIHPDDRQKVEASNQSVIQHAKPITVEYRVVWPDGSVRVVWAEAGELTRDESGHPAALTGIVHDITDRKRIEDALRDSNTLLQRTLAGLDEAVFVMNVETRRILMCSPSVERVFGYRPEELVGETTRALHVSQESFQDFLPERLAATGPDGVAHGHRPRELVGETTRVLHVSQESFQGFLPERLEATRSDGIAHLEYQMRRKDGTVFWSENTVAELKSEPGSPPLVVSVVRDITERKQAEGMIRASLREKEILLREIHHRVKNNLQIIASLLTIQAQSVRDPVALEVLQDSQNRIRAMSLIHAKLYESSDLARVDFGAFVRDLGTILLRAYAVTPSAIHLRVSADLDIDTLVPCSLIVNELLANAVKHAFPSGASGTITVELSQQDGAYALRVADDGVGFPGTVDFRNTKSLGLRLVNMLVEQLDGTIEMRNEGGTEFTIRFQRGASV